LQQQSAAASGAGVRMLHSPEPSVVLRGAKEAVLVVDALLGTGLRRPPRPTHAEVIESLTGLVLSIDVPSGLDATTGRALGAAVRAHTTCTLCAVKSGMWNPRARSYTGEIVVADIGMPQTAWRDAGLRSPTSVRGGRLITLRP
jgi:hydroxyethylthiazole kinase-like uncharacterized protein yjeF